MLISESRSIEIISGYHYRILLYIKVSSLTA